MTNRPKSHEMNANLRAFAKALLTATRVTTMVALPFWGLQGVAPATALAGPVQKSPARAINQTARQLVRAVRVGERQGQEEILAHVISVHSGIPAARLLAGDSLATSTPAAMTARATGVSFETAVERLGTGEKAGKVIVDSGADVAAAQALLVAALAGVNANSRAAAAGAPDTDEDGVWNAMDSDADNDGIENRTDVDVDGDGTSNREDGDVDDDGMDNGDDDDIDGDDVPNSDDDDTDGDGDDNPSDSDDDGDGTSDDSDEDDDGDGTDDSDDTDDDSDDTDDDSDDDSGDDSDDDSGDDSGDDSDDDSSDDGGSTGGRIG